MSKIDTTIWEIGPHTEAKHIILRKYLDAWLPIISRYNGRVIYIDGFAGPGKYKGNKDGSPLIALKAVVEHKLRPQMKAEFNFLFIDHEKDICDYLQQVLSELEIPEDLKINIHVECSEFDKKLGEILNLIKKENSILAPTFVFVDPFGFSGVPFNLISDLMNNKKCEILITFMYEDIDRWKKLFMNKGHLDSLFGTSEWQKINNEDLSSKEKLFRLHSLYKSQLENKAKIKFVRSFMMINKYNKPDYFLFFGTNNELGLERMKEAMWKVDKIGTFQFSDVTYDPEQAVLFEPMPMFSKLKKEILLEFEGKEVKIEDIETFVIQKTAFLRGHIRKNILDKMESNDPPEIEVYSPKKRREGTYPPGTIIKFL